MANNKEHKEKLLQIVRDAVQHNQALREQYQMADKFRFIRDRLGILLNQVEDHLSSLHGSAQTKNVTELTEDEMMVYVYLYNAQGVLLPTWQKMVTPAVFYEYSVNRPIYAEKSHVDSFIKRRSNPVQHGYLTVAIKKDHLLTVESAITKDALGNPIYKVKEGSLRFERLLSFTHNHLDYIVNEAGELIKKD